MALWQLILVFVWIYICTRRPERTKKEKEREETVAIGHDQDTATCRYLVEVEFIRLGTRRIRSTG